MLTQKLQDDLIKSLKAHQQDRVDTIRLLLSEVKNAEIARQTQLTDDDVLLVIKKEVKKLKEALDMFETAQRTDLASQNKTQIAILSEYLPAELTDADLSKAIDDLIASNQTLIQSSPKAIIGLAMRTFSSQADPKRIMAILNSKTASE